MILESIASLGTMLRSGQTSAVKLVEATLARIADSDLDAFTVLTLDRAMATAARADAELRDGVDRGPLHGIPYGAKELLDVRGIATTGQSRLSFPPAGGDAHVVERLEKAGAILVGKTATYEFGIEPRASLDGPFPPARNPRNADHTTGGSSSGSAAAVGGGLVPFALGTDTGGSIRGPAAYCGVVGLKPTYGRVSKRGVFPLSYSLDHIGPLASSVEDAALALDAIAGRDPHDPTSADITHAPIANGLGQGVDGIRIGYVRNWHQSVGGPVIRGALDAAAQALGGLGAMVEEVELPDPALYDAVATLILQAEAFALHRHWLATHPDSYGASAYRHLAAGAIIAAADLVDAHRLRRQLTRELHAGPLKRFDVLLAANVLGTAPRLDDAGGTNSFRVFPFNVTGNPALALPIGSDAAGMPFGMQLVGRPFEEDLICRVGHAFERNVYSLKDQQ